MQRVGGRRDAEDSPQTSAANRSAACRPAGACGSIGRGHGDLERATGFAHHDTTGHDMTAQHKSRGERSFSGATAFAAFAALIPWAVLCCIWAFIFFASLWGTSVAGEEAFAVGFGVVLVVAAIGFCVLAGMAVARRTRFSRGGGFALAVLFAGLWTAAFLAWTISGGLRTLPPLPQPSALIVASGFTMPVAVLGILGLIAVAVFRRSGNSRTAADAVKT